MPIVLLAVVLLTGVAGRSLLRGGRRGPGTACFEAVLVGLCATALIALAVASCELFSVRLVMAIELGLALPVLVVQHRRRRIRCARLRCSRWAVAWAALALLAGLLFLRPHEIVGGGWDPAVYLHAGAAIESSGSIAYTDEYYAGLPADEQALFTLKPALRPERFPGFRIMDAGAGLVRPQFYHLLSGLLALIHATGGTPAALFLCPFLALLGVAAVAMTARTVFDRPAGLLAALLLTANIGQIWFARLCVAEIPAQCFLWGALYAYAVHVLRPSRGYAVLSAVLLLAACLSHITSLLPAAVFVAVAAWRMLHERTARNTKALVLFLAVGLVALAYNRVQAPAYIRLLAYVPVLFELPLVFFTAISVAAAAVMILSPSARRWVDARLRGRSFRAVLAAGLAVLALYAWFVRPVRDAAPGMEIDAATLKRTVASLRAFRDMAWFLTVPGLVLAVGGAMRLVRRARHSLDVLVWLVVVTSALVFFHDKRIEPFYMFTFRRFLPVVLPGAVVLIAFALSAVRRAGKPGRVAGLAAAAWIAVMPVYRYRVPVAVSDFSGTTAFLQDVAADIPDRPATVVLSDDAWLGAPLEFLHGRKTLVPVTRAAATYGELDRVLRGWLDRGMRVCYLTRGEQPFSTSLAFEPVAAHALFTSRAEQTLGRLPSRAVPRATAARIFNVRPAEAVHVDLPARVAVGTVTFGLIEGFGPPAYEVPAATRYRWTRGTMRAPCSAPDVRNASHVVLHLANARPPGADATEVAVHIDDQSCGRIHVPPDSPFRAYRLALPAGFAVRSNDSVITIVTETWTPADRMPSADRRRLGIMLSRIVFENAAGGQTALAVDVGRTIANRLQGVHGVETDTRPLRLEKPARPVADRAELVLPIPANDGEAPGGRPPVLAVRGFVAGHRPQPGTVTASVLLNGQLLGELRFSNQPSTGVLAVPYSIWQGLDNRAVMAFDVKTGAAVADEARLYIEAVELRGST